MSHRWLTWQGAEPDRGASAWFIRRYVDTKAEFFEWPAGTLTMGAGTPFDVPQARWRRTHAETTLDQLLRQHPIKDSAVQKLARVIHDIEINLWGSKLYPESALIEKSAREWAATLPGGTIPVSCYILWIDAIYIALRSGDTLREIPAAPQRCPDPIQQP